MSINPEIGDLRAFLAVFDLRSFHKASGAMALSQPALSRRIQSLEGMLGARLFERSTRHVAPTQVGRGFEPVFRRLIEDFDRSILDVGGGERRPGARIILACVPTAAAYFLPRVIERFNALQSGVSFRVLDDSANDGLESVARGEADFGINFVGASQGDLEFTPLFEDAFVLACKPDHPFARRDAIAWRDLDGQRLIGVSRSSGNRMLLDAALVKERVRLEWAYEVNHVMTSLGLVEAGLGLSVLPRLATPIGERSSFVVRPLINPEITRTIGVVERRGGHLSPAARRFRDLLVAEWASPRKPRKVRAGQASKTASSGVLA
jgi:DNA-binding transcriptional LysR family regulator